jgi:hypothetical protein
VYVIAHVLLAYAAMWSLMRAWDVTLPGATLAALGYAFGGPVLLLYCNVIFLVGAAWMPLAFLAADGWIRRGSRRSLAGLAAVLAMQTLGGDPEASYLAVVAAAGYGAGISLASSGRPVRRLVLIAAAACAAYLGLLVWSLWGAAPGQGGGLGWWPSTTRLALGCWLAAGVVLLVRLCWFRAWGVEARLLGVAGAAALALALAGVQVVPALEFIELSSRGDGATPASVYDQSLHPARLVEGLWPGFFGSVGRGNHRWLPVLPPIYDHMVWVDSVYVGAMTACLGLAAARLRKASSRRVWLTAVMIAGLAGSLGSYGSPLLWLRSFPALQPLVGAHVAADEGRMDPSAIPDGTGGPYWFLTAALPGFGSFRYPAKLLVITSLGICGLSGLGWDDLQAGISRRMWWLALGSLAVGLCAAVWFALPSTRAAFVSFLQARPDLSTTVFGPLDVPGAIVDVWWALVHGAAAAAILMALASRSKARYSGWLAAAASALDLGVAHRPLIYTIPQHILDARPRALDVIQSAEANDPSPGPFRIHRQANWAPAAWLAGGSADRLEDIVRWERDSLRSKYAITEGLAYASTRGTAELSELLPFFTSMPIRLDPEASRRNGFPEGYEVVYFTRRGFDLWNARYFILPARLALRSRFRGVLSLLPRTVEIDPPPGAFEGPDAAARRQHWLLKEDVQILRNQAAFPRAWIVHRARFFGPGSVRSPALRQRVMDEILYQDDELWHEEGRRVHDPRVVAWLEVEPDDRRRIAGALSGADADPSETVTIDRYEPDRVELTAHLGSAGLVVLADVFYPGWELSIDGVPAPILRANRAMRGALVPSGRHRLTYAYRPNSVRLGVVASVVGTLALLVLLRRGPAPGAQ